MSSVYKTFPRAKQWKGMSQAVRSHRCDPATWNEMFNFQLYRGITQCPPRIVLIDTFVPIVSPGP